jgi:hypothetical protein
MPILALGVSHRRASIELLERLALGKDEFAKAYHRLQQTEGVRGAVILSTCNRVEVFADVDAYHGGFQALKGFLSESRDVPPEELSEPLYSHYEDQAAAHLFSVAAGLDSMVLGEPQILSQVRQAYKTAEVEGTAGPVLQALFRRAIRTGRRARTETAIGASPSAFVDAGARLAERIAAGLSLFHREPSTAAAAGSAGARPADLPPLDPRSLTDALARSIDLVVAPPPPPEIVPRTVTLEERAAIIRRALLRAPQVVLQDLLRGISDRVVLAVTFMAMLEMVKGRELTVEQAEPWGPIVCRRPDAADHEDVASASGDAA